MASTTNVCAYKCRVIGYHSEGQGENMIEKQCVIFLDFSRFLLLGDEGREWSPTIAEHTVEKIIGDELPMV